MQTNTKLYKVLLTICLTLYITALWAQPSFTTDDKTEAAALKKGKLAVVVQEQDDKVVKKLAKKPDELKKYEESIQLFNAYIKKAVEQEWSLTKEVSFISQAEAEQAKTAKPPGLYLMEVTEVKNYAMGDFYLANQSNKGFQNTPRDRAYHLTIGGKSIGLAVYAAAKPNREFLMSYLPAAGLSQGAVTFMVRHLQNQVNDCLEQNITGMSALRNDIDKREASLKDKTLLLFEPLISTPLQKVMDKKELGEFYPYTTEVVSYERLEEVIASKDNKYAYIWVVPAAAWANGRMLFNYFIIDAADSRMLFLTGTSVANANGQFHPMQLKMVKKRVK